MNDIDFFIADVNDIEALNKLRIREDGSFAFMVYLKSGNSFRAEGKDRWDFLIEVTSKNKLKEVL